MYLVLLTNDAKDAQNIWSKYHQHIDEGEQNEGDGSVAQPVERLGGEYHLHDGSTHLWKEIRNIRAEDSINKWYNNNILIYIYENKEWTYREQYNRNSQCDSSEDSHSHTQDQSVIWIDPTVGVQQFRLHVACGNVNSGFMLSFPSKHTFCYWAKLLWHTFTRRGSMDPISSPWILYDIVSTENS